MVLQFFLPKYSKLVSYILSIAKNTLQKEMDGWLDEWMIGKWHFSFGLDDKCQLALSHDIFLGHKDAAASLQRKKAEKPLTGTIHRSSGSLSVESISVGQSGKLKKRTDDTAISV